MNKTVCHLSFNHDAYDDRIYWKELLSLKKAGYKIIHITVSERNADFISKEGIQIIEVKRRTKHPNIYVNRLLQFLFKKGSTIEMLYEKAASLQADIYHYHDLQLNGISKRLKSLPHRPKLIYDAHEAYHLLMLEAQHNNFIHKAVFSIYSKLVQRWEIKNAAYCDHIIVTDEYTEEYFKRTLPHVSVTTVYNYSYFTKISEIGVKNYHFIYTGLMSESRGTEAIILATSIAVKKREDIKILLIGPFETQHFQEFIIQLISSKGLNAHIILKKEVAFKEIANYYSESMVGLGLFHKTPKYTTFIPIKLFEYMAFGLPVIFSDHGPSAKIISDENCGLLVDYTNSNAIAEAMLQLLSNKELYDKLGNNGKKAIERKYNWDNEKQKLLDLYTALLH